MTNYIDFRTRRAKHGYGTRKAELIQKERELTNDITHFIIAKQAGSKEYEVERAAAEIERATIQAELLSITI